MPVTVAPLRSATSCATAPMPQPTSSTFSPLWTRSTKKSWYRHVAVLRMHPAAVTHGKLALHRIHPVFDPEQQPEASIAGDTPRARRARYPPMASIHAASSRRSNPCSMLSGRSTLSPDLLLSTTSSFRSTTSRSTIVPMLHPSTIAARAASPRRRASGASLNRRTTAVARATVSGAASSPVCSWRITSAIPGTSVPTTGIPAAIASSSAFGCPSNRDGSTKTLLRCMNPGSCSEGTRPSQSTLPLTEAGCARNAASSGP